MMPTKLAWEFIDLLVLLLVRALVVVLAAQGHDEMRGGSLPDVLNARGGRG